MTTAKQKSRIEPVSFTSPSPCSFQDAPHNASNIYPHPLLSFHPLPSLPLAAHIVHPLVAMPTAKAFISARPLLACGSCSSPRVTAVRRVCAECLSTLGPSLETCPCPSSALPPPSLAYCKGIKTSGSKLQRKSLDREGRLKDLIIKPEDSRGKKNENSADW